MAKRMLIDALHAEETRVAIADDNQIFDFDFVSTAKKQLKGNIYLAKITRVEPSLQAAFVEYGGGKQGFLPFSEIHADYYQIPMSDRIRLMDEVEESEDVPPPQAAPAAESYGEQPVIENEAATEHKSDEASTESLELPSSENVDERPAYLTQGAIDTSHLEEGESAEHPEEGEPFLGEAAISATAEHDVASESKGVEPAGNSEEIETIASEEDEYQDRPKKNQFHKRYKIQEVIRRGQIVLVQVIKEERGNKGVSLTTYLSLAGRYCVLMPNSPKDGGISRKIASTDDRKRLKAIYTELKLAAGMSVIIRTAGMDRTRAEIKRDYDYLVKLWNQIREDTLKSNAPALIYEESDIIKRAIRDQYTSDIDELIIEGETGYKAAKEFMKLLLPSHTPKIKHYHEPTPLFYAYNIEEQLLSMHDPIVKLKSGGYIVINPTEALISIDVNSGRATGERNIEETAAKTNLEAAVEVARQLRLRDLAGLIVIDFIDMLESRNRRAVEKTLKDSLKADRAKIQLGRISPFGLLEMSRQRLRSSISETNMVQCPHCTGRGVIRSHESMSIQMIRAIEKEASAGIFAVLRLVAPQGVALHMLNSKRDILRAIEQRYNLTLQVTIGTDLTASDFTLEKIRRSGEQQRNERGERGERSENSERRPRRPERERERERPRPVPVEADEASNDNADSDKDAGREEGGTAEEKRRRGRSRRGGRGRRERPAVVAGTDTQIQADAPVIDTNDSDNGEAAIPAIEGEAAASGRPPRQRGGRGRRRWRDRDDRPERKEGEPAMAEAGAPDTNHEAVATSYSHNDGNTLPAFATEDRLPVIPRSQPPVAEKVESTPRDPNAPAKKGWWQKMIELDD